MPQLTKRTKAMSASASEKAQGSLAGYSNFGLTTVDVGGPGAVDRTFSSTVPYSLGVTIVTGVAQPAKRGTARKTPGAKPPAV